MYPNTIRIQNYKCFQDDLQGFEKLLPINIIIGKNNAGKSTLIDIIENICIRNGSFQSILSEVIFTQSEFEQFLSNYSHSLIEDKDEVQQYYELNLKGTKFYYVLKYDNNKLEFKFNEQNNINPSIPKFHGVDILGIISKYPINLPLSRNFRRLNAERNINPEGVNNSFNIASNGEGATNTIQQFYTRIDLNLRKVITNEFLNILNSILNPEIEFKEISTQIGANGLWEICFEDYFGNNIPLSQMGSGIKTIILTISNLILLPILDNTKTSNYVFAFEELENNLHPSLQRKLYQFLKEFIIKEECTLFLTTHSNIGIDIFYNCENAQLISVNNENGVSVCKTIIQNDQISDILSHLGFKASDLLQTNGIIWVEGPSDRVYLKKWINLLNNNLVEGVHYSIMFYGGKLLSNLSFKENVFKELISLLKINRNAYVIIDKDARKMTDTLNKTKERIQLEIGVNKCWITSGREIENYITETTIKKWMTSKGLEYLKSMEYDKFNKFELLVPNISPLYNLNKNGYSKEIESYIEQGDLDILDLKTKIQDIVNSIEYWNS